MANPAKNTICLWYDGGAEDAARFYAETFPDSSVSAVSPRDSTESASERLRASSSAIFCSIVPWVMNRWTCTGRV